MSPAAQATAAQAAMAAQLAADRELPCRRDGRDDNDYKWQRWPGMAQAGTR